MYDAYFTHLPVLMAIVARTTGPILELGCGYYSTLVLHYLCKATGRKLVTSEINKEWLDKFTHLQSDFHQLIYVPDWNKFEMIDNQRWSVAFVDHWPGEQRHIDIMRLKQTADYQVIHDTEANCYEFHEVLDKFKYHYKHTDLHPNTSVVSDLYECTI